MSEHSEPTPNMQDSDYESLWLRLVNMVIIALLISMATTLLSLMTVAQFLIMLFSNREPNEQLAEMGDTMGMWLAKAARYQLATSEVKPWPWTELD